MQEDHWSTFQQLAKRHGLDCLGVTDTQLQASAPYLQRWLDQGMHGEMGYMERHGLSRLDANLLLPGTVRIVSVRIPYIPPSLLNEQEPKDLFAETLKKVQTGSTPYISLYARGRDYHKVIRQTLQRFADDVHKSLGEFGYRVACDSAPTPEVEIARKAGLGWRGKHTLLINPKEGSFFFLGEIFTNLELPMDGAFESNHCGECSACIDICPTKAIVADGVVDARRCISYLTIEHDSAIPLEFRKSIGTRIYGCDDCQLVCPWNKFAKPAVHPDFEARHGFDQPDLLTLLGWTEVDFLKRTEGMAMRRIGYKRFTRNLAIAAGNYRPAEGQAHVELMAKLRELRGKADDFLAEHLDWALMELSSVDQDA